MALFAGSVGETAARPPRGGAPGTVHLVGAGPGDPSLLTVRAAELLRAADVVSYDTLISPAILELVRPAALRIPVGCRKGEVVCAPRAIRDGLVAWARRGASVVRLKGGDPLIFGRAGEEIEALRAAGLRIEIVPGVTAASAAAAALSISLTQRGQSSSFAFVSGHGEPSYGEEARRLDELAEIARAVETIAVYMGATRAAAIARALLDAGRDAREGVAVIERASLPDERIHRMTLGELARTAAREPFHRPALILIGPTVAAAPLPSNSHRIPAAALAASDTSAKEQE
jgi:uroporphyrin-III C-methyltransferase